MELIPLALSFLAFFVCCVGAITYVIAQRDKGKRITGVILAFFSIVLLFPFVPILPRMGITRANIAGAYEGVVGGYRQRLELRSNGTFQQHLTSAAGNIYDNKGTWSVTDSGWGQIDLDHVLTTQLLAGEKPELGSQDIEVRGYDGALMYNEDTDEHLSRVR